MTEPMKYIISIIVSLGLAWWLVSSTVNCTDYVGSLKKNVPLVCLRADTDAELNAYLNQEYSIK